MTNDITDIVENAALRFTEQRLTDFFGEPVKLTKPEFRAYSKAMAEVERQNEIEAAIDLLKSEGYTVTK